MRILISTKAAPAVKPPPPAKVATPAGSRRVTMDELHRGGGVGNHHPAEYFAESILSPNAIIVDAPGFIGPDGRSIMPSYADSLTVMQLVDLVGFLKSPEGGHGGHGGHGSAAPRRAR